MRELPIINIEGTDFLVDVNKLVLREKSNPANTISILDMKDLQGKGYMFDYDKKEKNISLYFSSDDEVEVVIPELVKLDPVGMAKKYGYPDVFRQTDFTLMVDQEFLYIRKNRGKLPTLSIEGHTYYADAEWGLLKKEEYSKEGIKFSDIKPYFVNDEDAYLIPYNPKTHNFQELDYENITQNPRNLVAVRFPSEQLLDPVGWNRRFRFNDLAHLKKTGLKLHFEAETVPWDKTFLADVIRKNLEKILKPTVKQPTANKSTKKGRGL